MDHTQAPPREAFTRHERKIIETYRNPKQVQGFLRSLRYNHERLGETLRSFREIAKIRQVHCLEAALTATTILDSTAIRPWW